MAEKREQLWVSVPPNTKRRLTEEAQHEKRNLSSMAEMLFDEALDAREAKRKDAA